MLPLRLVKTLQINTERIFYSFSSTSFMCKGFCKLTCARYLGLAVEKDMCTLLTHYAHYATQVHYEFMDKNCMPTVSSYSL